jgi:hypothetical protein
VNLDEYLKVVGDYADQIARAEKDADRDSMAAAVAMEEIYESRVWVEEWLLQKPPPHRPSNAFKADSRNRFAQWQAWKLQDAGRATITGSRTYQLIAAPKIARALNFNPVEIRTERSLRPFNWVLRNRYDNRLPEIRTYLDEQTGGEAANVSERASREALKKWKAKTFVRADGTPKTNRAVTAAAKANSLRARMLDEFNELYRLACENEKAQDEFNGLLADLDAFLDAHAEDAA